MNNQKTTSTVRPSNPILIGKKPKFLNLVYIRDEINFILFPKEVRAAVHPIDETSFSVDSLEYADGEVLTYPCFVAWEKPDPAKHTKEEMARIPTGYNLWNKSNAAQQIADGIIEDVCGKFRLTKIVPLQAQLFTGEIPEIFEKMPRFDGQVTVKQETALLSYTVSVVIPQMRSSLGNWMATSLPWEPLPLRTITM